MFLKNKLTAAKKCWIYEPTLFPRNNSVCTAFCLVNPKLLIAVSEGLLGGKRVIEGRLMPPKKCLCICFYLPICPRALLVDGQRSLVEPACPSSSVCLLLHHRAVGMGPALIMSEGRRERQPRMGCHHQNYSSDHKLIPASVDEDK